MTPKREILLGDVRETLKQVPDNSVHCVVTSPPYFALRAYGNDSREIGREKTPEEFIETMVGVFREVRRVLRPDGTCWVNMGDSYNGSGRSGGEAIADRGDMVHRGKTNEPAIRVSGLKPKDLIGIPWMLAFALRADGWYLRCDIIWSKPNCMPESVYDRPTKSHEYIFLLTKSARYFYDDEAIKEEVTGNAHPRGDGVNPKAKAAGKNSRMHVDRDPAHLKQDQVENRRYNGFNERWKNRQNESFSAAISGGVISKRNKRSVWPIATSPFTDAHFATFPPELIKPCIMAGASEGGCCAECGTPRERIVELGEPDIEHQRACGGDLNGEYFGQSKKGYATSKAQDASATKARILAGMREKKTIGWKKACDCKTEAFIPCTVLDPFAGSGTSGEVSGELGRSFIGCELYEKFLPMINRRTAQPGLLLA